MTSIEISSGRADVQVSRRGSATQAAVSGDLSWKTAAATRTAIERVLPAARLLVDLRDVGYIDSVGTGALIKLFLRCHHEGTALAFVVDGGKVGRAMRRVGLADAVAVLAGDDDVDRWVRA